MYAIFLLLFTPLFPKIFTQIFTQFYFCVSRLFFSHNVSCGFYRAIFGPFVSSFSFSRNTLLFFVVVSVTCAMERKKKGRLGPFSPGRFFFFFSLHAEHGKGAARFKKKKGGRSGGKEKGHHGSSFAKRWAQTGTAGYSSDSCSCPRGCSPFRRRRSKRCPREV